MTSITENRPAAMADIAPFLDRIGAPPPAALRHLEETVHMRDKTGLTVTFNFGKKLEPDQALSVAAYCASAFNALGFEAAPAARPQIEHAHRNTNVTLRFPADGIPGDMRAKPKKYDYELDEFEKVDSVGKLWTALRTVRQAAKLA